MIKGKDIICHAFPAWDGDYMKAVVQLMKALAKHNRVLYVNYHYTLKDLLTAQLNKGAPKTGGIFNSKGYLEHKVQNAQGDLYLLNPPVVLPTNFIKNEWLYQAAQRQQAKRVGRAINLAIEELEFEEPILINAFNPQFGLPLIDELNVAKTIYYCYDEISAAEWSKAHGADAEKEYLKKVDGVVVTSASLYHSKSQYNSNCHFVPNGVDHSLFSKALGIPRTGKKVIGYVGSVDNRIDYELLRKVAMNNLGSTVRLIGRIRSDKAIGLARQFPNIELTGAKQPNELADEVAKIDIGLIPFVTNEFTKNIYPLKVNEYLAAGKPVVSTAFACLKEFNGVIAIEESHGGFISAISRQLKSDHLKLQHLRSRWAKKNSWAQRAELFSEVLEAC